MISEKDVVPGKPEESPLVMRLMKPIADDSHMPPREKPQPTADEIAMVTAWVANGAKTNAPFAKSRVPASVLSAPAEPPPPAPASTNAHAGEPQSAVAALKVPPGSGGCGACAIGAGAGERVRHGDGAQDLRGLWLFVLGLAFVVLRRHGGAANRLPE